MYCEKVVDAFRVERQFYKRKLHALAYAHYLHRMIQGGILAVMAEQLL